MLNVLDVVAANGVPFRWVLQETQDDKYGKVVHVFDRRFDHTDNGQFVSSYYVANLLKDFRVNGHFGLCLNGGVDNWTVDSETMTLVTQWLRHEI